MNKIKPGCIVEYDDGHYVVEREVLMKHPVTGEWVGAFLYECAERGSYYVRERTDFLAKFRWVEDPPQEEAFICTCALGLGPPQPKVV